MIKRGFDYKNVKMLALVAFSALALSACASSGGIDGEIADPIEGVNRGILKFNDAVDTAVLKPVAKGYRYAVPQPARTGVRNVLRNLKSPVVLANQLLQADLPGAGNTALRAAANTLIGVGGIFDVASAGGIPYEEEDFGQTMGKWGVGHGAYLMLPVFGPSSLRDGAGMIVDSYADPLSNWLMNTDREEWYYAKLGVATVDKREELLDVLDDLKKNSVDYYAALRSAYTQRRAAEVRDQSDAGLEEIPNY